MARSAVGHPSKSVMSATGTVCASTSIPSGVSTRAVMSTTASPPKAAPMSSARRRTFPGVPASNHR
ncbi:MAG: hypothetical protein DME11_12755 [Candidatus Rokuibacteriota bacterium]|nr:MAG: hypothetical protein DME11_12755 [Candidatus Rokubacteria bacterium]PYN68870.1 MAG: hypothetical protein DMD93_09135 [Candidatus Rokubacteria bacterium]